MNTIDFATSCTCFNMRKAARAVTSLYDEILRGTGLRATQVTLLMAAASTDMPTISQLSEQLVMDRTTLARDLKPLQARGLIDVQPGEDRRTRLVRLTAAGQRKLDEAVPLWQHAQAHMIAEGLGAARWRALYDDLQDVVQIAQS